MRLSTSKNPITALVTLSVIVTVGARADQTNDLTVGEPSEVAPLLREMGAAANAHDVERHVGFYAHDAAVTLIVNGEAIVGWEGIRDRQRDWWRNGKTDVVYQVQGKPDVRWLAPGIVVTTLFMTSTRTLPDGKPGEKNFAVSSIWQKRPEGWRVIYSHESTTH